MLKFYFNNNNVYEMDDTISHTELSSWKTSVCSLSLNIHDQAATYSVVCAFCSRHLGEDHYWALIAYLSIPSTSLSIKLSQIWKMAHFLLYLYFFNFLQFICYYQLVAFYKNLFNNEKIHKTFWQNLFFIKFLTKFRKRKVE